MSHKRRGWTYLNRAWRRSAATLFIALFFACLGASAQDAATPTPNGIDSPLSVAALPSARHKLDLSVTKASTEKMGFSDRGVALATIARPDANGVFRLTLDEAQQRAVREANNPMVRLGELGIEAAKQHRLGVQAQYFPAMSTTFFDLHYNKHPGEVLTTEGPLGAARQVSVNIINKDSNTLNLIAVQPITPLFSVYQLAKIARADENIARAKAGMPVAETAMKVEKAFFDLLVAQRELTSAESDSRKTQAKWLTASNSGKPFVSTAQETDMLRAEKAVLLATGKVKELTVALNGLVGLPEATTLELIPPEPLVENISEQEATEKAVVNPEVIEAEQTAVKAHAGLTLTKLTYVPTVGVMGGYAFQNAINLVLPRSFGYIGLSASWTIFDFGKREHSVKEVKAQAAMADLGVQLAKAKVAAKVKSTYLELDHSRQLYQLARRMVSATQVIEAGYNRDDPDVESARAKMEADMFRAELEYRQAYGKVKALMGTR